MIIIIAISYDIWAAEQTWRDNDDNEWINLRDLTSQDYERQHNSAATTFVPFTQQGSGSRILVTICLGPPKSLETPLHLLQYV